MMTFKSLLTEATTSSEKLAVIDHPENHPISHDFQGARHAIDTLNGVHDSLRKQKSGAKIITEYEGQPVVFGRHPDNGRFFVTSKAGFKSKNQKLNYTEQDIDANHGDDKHLKTALEHLPKVSPPEGVYQGDVLYTAEDVQHDGKLFNFKPGSVSYVAHEASPQGQKIKGAKIGIAVHTKYDGDNLKEMKPSYDVDHNNFGTNMHVHVVDPTVDTSKIFHSPQSQKAFSKHIAEATDIASNMEYDHHSDHRGMINKHITTQISAGERPSVASYKKWVAEQPGGEKMVEDVKNDKESFDNTFKLHHHLTQAKNALIESLGTHTEFAHKVGDVSVGPSGHIAIVNGKPSKLVDRYEATKTASLKSTFRRKANASTSNSNT